MDYAIITMDRDGCITGWNAGAQQILGYAEAEVLGRSGEIVFTAEDRRDGVFHRELGRARETGRAINERWQIRHDGARFWASGLMLPLLDADDRWSGFLNILRDRTEVQAQAERRELMMAEMNHRMKNTFALVQATAAESSRYAQSIEAFRSSFEDRLAALARSHDMLIRGEWKDASLHEVIQGALRPYCADDGRVSIEGPVVTLAPNLVIAATLAFHELATNAVKHGALSVPTGVVEVNWTITSSPGASRQVEVLWQERGGPAVKTPRRQGFGSRLLSRGLDQFGSSLKIDFAPQGVECRLCLPLGAS